MTPTRTKLTLTGKQRSYLRSLAHALKPVVRIGHGGLTDSVVEAIDGALATHELIKVKFAGNEEVSSEDLVPEIEQRTRSIVAQAIGKTLVVYRPRKKDPTIVLPKASAGKEKAR